MIQPKMYIKYFIVITNYKGLSERNIPYWNSYLKILHNFAPLGYFMITQTTDKICRICQNALWRVNHIQFDAQNGDHQCNILNRQKCITAFVFIIVVEKQ